MMVETHNDTLSRALGSAIGAQFAALSCHETDPLCEEILDAVAQEIMEMITHTRTPLEKEEWDLLRAQVDRDAASWPSEIPLGYPVLLLAVLCATYATLCYDALLRGDPEADALARAALAQEDLALRIVIRKEEDDGRRHGTPSP